MKQRNHRTRRAQHIAEAHHGEPGLVDARDIRLFAQQYRRNLPTQRLKGHLGKPLGTAHHIGGAYRLVGRDQHEIGDTRLQCGLRSIKRTHHIVQHAFGDIVLDHWNVLVRGGVIDGVHAPGFHDIQQFMGMTNGPQDRQQPDRRRLPGSTPLELGKNVVKVELTVLEQQKRGRTNGENLSTQLRTD
ncbi:hypothetical protein D3C84_681850 [compost metagenome]